MPNPLTAKRLRVVLSYDRRTGVFRWKVRLSNRAPIGSVAGSVNDRGYLNIQIDGVMYTAHRLAWLYVHGWMPALVDHKNQKTLQNNIANLRSATPSQNQGNRRKQSKPTSSKFKGVCWHAASQKWMAAIRIGHDKKRYLGVFEVEGTAAAAYRAAARERFGKFARAA